VKKWVDEGKLAVVAVSQEQQSDRCRLFAIWQQLDFPILHDPINLLGARGVPIIIAIDEYGIVRSSRPNMRDLERDFLAMHFEPPEPTVPAGASGDEPEGSEQPAPGASTTRPDFKKLKREAESTNTAQAWRTYADLLVIYEGTLALDQAITAYANATRLDHKDAKSLFRLGVCYRMRHESKARQVGDAQKAMQYWRQASKLEPSQYIWRRRIQQYSAPSQRPYLFYDWMPRARQEIKAIGRQLPDVAGSAIDDFPDSAGPAQGDP